MKTNILRMINLLLVLFLSIVSCEKDISTEPETSGIKLILPVQDTVWKNGSECLIKWENDSGRPVTIDLYAGNGFILQIGTFSHLMTEYSYIVPDSIVPASDYFLKLYIADKPETAVTSVKFSVLEKDNLFPTCLIVNPKDGNYITAGEIVHITVEADDPDGHISLTRFYIDGIYSGQVPKDSFVYPWDTANTDIGLHTIAAVAIDNDEEESTMFEIKVVITDGLSNVELVKIPSGNFTMGSYIGDADETPENLVYLTGNYYMGKYEITNAQYSEILNYAIREGELTGNYQNNATVKNLYGTQKELLDLDDPACEISFNGTEFIPDPGKENRPAVELTWWGASFYCNMLSRRLKVEELYDLNEWKCNFEKTGYRLPTEAEWEYTAKFDDRRRYPWGNTDPDSTMCNYGLNVGYTTDAGSYSPLGDSYLGLCDMAGNVWEWCNDWYNFYPITYSFLVNPEGPDHGSDKVLRGGSMISSAFYIRTSYRNCYPLTSGYNFGMRVLLSIK